MLDTKAAEDYLRPLARQAAGLAAVTIPDTQAAIPAEDLAERARSVGITAEAAEDVTEALDRVLARAGKRPLRILICGSLYLAGAVLRENG